MSARPRDRIVNKRCKACVHPLRDEIETNFVFKRLTAGLARSKGEIDPYLEKYDIHYQSVANHMQKHVSGDDLTLIYAQEREKTAKGIVESDRTDVIATLHKLSDEASEFLEKAKTNEDIRAGVAVIAELRKQVELAAKLLGQLGENNSTLILAKHPEWIKVRSILLEVLNEHPQAKESFLKRIGTAAIGHDVPK